jgi:dTDP-4-amino-4,6-dideoxygalactose transaminase
VSAGVLIGVYPTLARVAAARSGPRAFPFTEPGLTLTHLGRGAVWLGMRALGLGPGSRVAMPAYHCGSDVEAVRLAGAQIDFYRVDASLRVDEGDLARAAASADATYLISHFGFPLPPPPDGLVIEDAAHGLFSDGPEGPLGSRGDAAIFCQRKSLGVPDGGALLLRQGERVTARGRPPGEAMARSLVSLLAGRAALAERRLVRRVASALIGRASRADAAAQTGVLTKTVIGEWDLEVADMESAASRPSRLTALAAPVADAEAIRARRRANYALLASELGELCPEPYRELPSGTCPLYFPVLAADRSAAIARMLESGVRAIEVWPVPHPLLDRERFAELEPARAQLLALPVHQDLEPRHMDIVTRAAAAALAARP